MKNQQKNFVTAEKVAFEIEKIVRATQPDFVKSTLDINNKDTYDTLVNEIHLVVEVLLEKKLIPKYDIIGLVDYYNYTSNLSALILIEIDYLDQINSIRDIPNLIKIRDIPRFNIVHSKSRKERCDARINEVLIARISKFSKLLNKTDTYHEGIRKIELTLANCHPGPAYSSALKKLISHYKSEVEQLKTDDEIETYLSNLEKRKMVFLNYSREGMEFLGYCQQLQRKHKAIADKNTKQTDPGCLLKVLNESIKPTDSNYYWHVYRNLLINNSESYKANHAFTKLVESIQTRTSAVTNYQEVYDIFYQPHEDREDKISENLMNNETVFNIVTERMSKASIYQLECSIVTFCYCNNTKFYLCLIDHFFKNKPSVTEISSFEKELLSIKNFLDEYPAVFDYFYVCLNFYIVNTKPIISDEDIIKYLAIAKINPICNVSRKFLIEKLIEADS